MIQGNVSRPSRNVAFVILVLAVALAFAFSRLFTHLAHAIGALIGAKAYEPTLGNSLDGGFQPNGDSNHGYVDDFLRNLQNLHLITPSLLFSGLAPIARAPRPFIRT